MQGRDGEQGANGWPKECRRHYLEVALTNLRLILCVSNIHYQRRGVKTLSLTRAMMTTSARWNDADVEARLAVSGAATAVSVPSQCYVSATLYHQSPLFSTLFPI